MAISRQHQQTRKNLRIMFLTSFILAFSAALVSYNNSSFLETKIVQSKVGLIFTTAYLFAFVVINYYARIIRKFGNYKMFLVMILINISSLVGLAFSPSILWVLISFLLYVISLMLLWISLDIYINFFCGLGDTGRIRGISLSLMNFGWILGPAVSGAIISILGFKYSYLAAALVVLPALIVVLVKFKGITLDFKEHKHAPLSFLVLIKKIIKKRELRDIFWIALTLQFFYTWMVIYTPLYLKGLGYSFTQIGFMFTIMLFPFVLFQYPAGYLADKYFGETEMLTLGILVMGSATLSIFFVSGFWGLSLALFATRVGASIIEILRDSYFYKIIKSSDIELINIFRDTGPLARIVAPLIASGVLVFVGIKYLFILLAIIIFLALFSSARMPDTK